jgi:hypothetical protein
MAPHMASLVPHLTTACQIRHLRISVPLVECLVDGVRYFRPDDLPPASGEELRPLYRPRIAQATAPARPRGPYSPLLLMPPRQTAGVRGVARGLSADRRSWPQLRRQIAVLFVSEPASRARLVLLASELTTHRREWRAMGPVTSRAFVLCSAGIATMALDSPVPSAIIRRWAGYLKP